MAGDDHRRQCWVRGNSRPFWLALPLPLAALGVGVWMVTRGSGWTALSGCFIAAGGAILVSGLWGAIRTPRIACDGERLLLYLRFGAPIGVPVELAEGFLRGQGPTMAGPTAKEEPDQQPQTANLVLRIAERAAEWQQVEVEPRLAQWCGGYVTIRGAHCEPITVELVRGLNQRLTERRRALRETR